MSSFRKILVATDFSPHAANALQLASELAKTCDAAIQLVHVYDVIPYTLPEGMPVYDAAQLAQVREGLGVQLRKAESQLKSSGVRETESALREGQASVEIARVAQEGGFDLIVMGTHGRTGVAHLLLGSVAERVIRKSPCPVLVVPMKSEG